MDARVSAAKESFHQHCPVVEQLALMNFRTVYMPAPVSIAHVRVNLYIIAEKSGFVLLIQYC